MTQPTKKQFSLDAKCKIRLKREVASILKQGKIAQEGFLRAAWMPGATPQSRIAIRVSGKVGNAIQRNRIKRLLREIFRMERSRFTQPVDLVFLLRYPLAKIHLRHALFKTNFTLLCRKAGFLA